MLQKDIQYCNTRPPIDIFIQMRIHCGWGEISHTQAQKALHNSVYVITARYKTQVIGFGRVVGDGALNYYIQDLIVASEYRNEGVGKKILRTLLMQIEKSNPKGYYTVGLMAAKNADDFYTKFGFVSRPSHRLGAGMTLEVNA